MSDHLMSNYARLPVTFERGVGAWLWDTEGKQYLDALSGIGVCGLGHAHAAITAALADQAGKLIHTSNLYHIDLQQALAERLCTLAGMDSAFFCNSGAEAIEAALKLARLYGHQRQIDSPAVIVTDNSFHGRTLATLSATGNRKVQAGFEPLVQGFIRVPFNDIEALSTVAANRPDAVAVLVEPIQGEGGINMPDSDYLSQLRQLCDQQGWLLMLDEIQTGIGRTGQWLAFQHAGIKPDVISIAKGLGNGVPIGACLASGPAATLFQPGHHGSTFGGNPLACRAALTVLEVIEQQQLLQRAAQVGKHLLTTLQQSLADCPLVKQVRGQGLMIGIELQQDCTELLSLALAQGLLISVQAQRVIRLLPPLIITDDEANEIARRVTTLVRDFAAAQQA